MYLFSLAVFLFFCFGGVSSAAGRVLRAMMMTGRRRRRLSKRLDPRCPNPQHRTAPRRFPQNVLDGRAENQEGQSMEVVSCVEETRQIKHSVLEGKAGTARLPKAARRRPQTLASNPWLSLLENPHHRCSFKDFQGLTFFFQASADNLFVSTPGNPQAPGTSTRPHR